ncbi:MAG: acyl-CoA dehydrogenase family protein [Candidatus Aminicenantes bacterium]|nr:acyl-CoA dehydrogenase family protein [Candidatus Aminicenantes bacterium]
MDFRLSEEQEMLKQTVRNFAEKEILPVRQEWDEKEEFNYELTQKMFDLGFFGIVIPEEYGGMGMDYLSYILVVEELARVDGCQAATVAAGNSLGSAPVYYYGNEKQRKEFLPELVSGKLFGFGLTEPNAGSDAGGTQTTAVQKGEKWILNGSKIFITNASTKITLGSIIQAVTGEREDGKKEYTCFLVRQDRPGYKAVPMHKKMTWRSSNTSEIYLDDVEVTGEDMLGKRGEGFHQMLESLDNGRLAIAAMGVGGAQGAFEAALNYSQERKQFGRPISRFQINAFKLADMATEIEAARTLLYKACWLKDNGKPFGKEAAMSKLYASEVMKRAAHEAVQIFGGYGLMEEYPVAKFYRDQRLLEIGEGTSEIQRLVIARKLGV